MLIFSLEINTDFMLGGKRMSESYTELLIKRRPTFGMTLAKSILIGLTGACLILTLLGNPFTLLGMVIFGAIFYVVRGKTDLEYEYLYVGGDLSVDKIIGRQKRKAVMNMAMEKVELVAPTNSEHLNEYKNKSLKKLDFTSNTGKPSYTIIYHGKEIQYRVLMELNEEIVDAMYNIAPRKVFKA